jgi:hypothetical protein
MGLVVVPYSFAAQLELFVEDAPTAGRNAIAIALKMARKFRSAFIGLFFFFPRRYVRSLSS